jgi:DNA-directed RNA polymerase specialized sigma24 family protein
VVILALYVGFAVMRLIRPGRAVAPPAAPIDDAPLRGLQTEMVGVRAQLDALQSALDALRGEVEQIKAARAVSPQYNDALSMAQKGMRPEDIAETCGISVGEADLVCALARSRREGGA